MTSKKKIGGVIKFPTNPQLVANEITLHPDEVKSSVAIPAQLDYYNFMYRDGQYLGMPYLYDFGLIYPFSMDPRKRGNKDKKKFTEIKVIAIPKNLTVHFSFEKDSPEIIEDKQGRKYQVSLRGTLYAKIPNDDCARSANLLYSKLLIDKNLDQFSINDLGDIIKGVVINRILAKIAEALNIGNDPKAPFAGLSTTQLFELETAILELLRDFGLAFDCFDNNTILKALSTLSVSRI